MLRTLIFEIEPNFFTIHDPEPNRTYNFLFEPEQNRTTQIFYGTQNVHVLNKP